MEVIITRRYKGNQAKDKYTFAGGGNKTTVNNTTINNVGSTYPEPDIFNFENTANPKILDYLTTYFPTYGRYPRLMLIVYQDSLENDDSENELVQYTPPKFNIVDGDLISIEYDLQQEMSGKIIINK